MNPGILKISSWIILFFIIFGNLNAQEKLNLEDLQPSFEEDSDFKELDENVNRPNIKSKKRKVIETNKTVVRLRALDKITAKTSDIEIIIGNKKRFGYLEILPKTCSKSSKRGEKGAVAYIQVKDLSEKKDDKVFVFNGWTFSSSTTLKTFDHPVYDLWLTGCENI